MSKSTSQKQRLPRPQPKTQRPDAARQEFPTVSGRWLLIALGLSAVGAAFCVWGALCIMFWQGSWQLLYHPKSHVTRTPASADIAFDNVAFATTDAGIAQLKGWWIPTAQSSRYTAVYLHGADGNIGDSVSTLSQLHSAGLAILAFDYRGYGASQFVHPSEAHFLEDVESALHYLIGTRHVAPRSILLVGQGLGANLALESAAANPEVAGVVLLDPAPEPTQVIYDDPRAHLVPAHWLVRDQWNVPAAVAALRVPALWLLHSPSPSASRFPSETLKQEKSPQMVVWLANPSEEPRDTESALARWLDGLPAAR